jgi:non-ribosomal peptide synthetase component F
MAAQKCFYGFSEFPSEEQGLLTRFGSGPKLSLPHTIVHEAFESIVDTYPTVVAARLRAETITYQQLDVAANRLAHHLIESGLRPRQRVCLVVQRSFEMLIGILAILKAGCQYVPIDGGVTSEQALQHIFTDTEARFILCLPKLWDKVRRFAKRDAIIIALEASTGAFYSTERPKCKTIPSDGAYAIYTSGKHGVHTPHIPSDKHMQEVLAHQRELMFRIRTSPTPCYWNQPLLVSRWVLRSHKY